MTNTLQTLKKLTTAQRKALLLFGAFPTNMYSHMPLDDPFYRGAISTSTMRALAKSGLAQECGTDGYWQLTDTGAACWKLLLWTLLEGDLELSITAKRVKA